MNGNIVLVLMFVVSFIVSIESASTSKDQFYLVVSFDGFRWDYLDMVKKKGRKTPNFDFLMQSGVKAKYMKNTFTTTTWPNHWTLATGLNAESHGVVANMFYDPLLQDIYDSPNTPDQKWYNNGSEGAGGEPIWVTYESSGGRSGAAVWPASTTPVNGKIPTYTLPQDNEGIAFKDRVDSIIEWFTHKQEPAHLGMLYFDEPDDTGHESGPYSKATEDKIVEMDGVIGYLLGKLRHVQLLHRVNMVITSDHGMDDNVITTYRLDEYVDPSLYILSGETPTLMFLPTEGNEEKLVAALKRIPHSKYYRKEDMPREYFYTYNNRILPHLLLFDDGFRSCCYNGSAPKTTVADHGYNNSHPNMWPFFIAHGPAFKSGFIAEPFNNTDIYPLMCHLLGVEPKPNNGSLENIRHILAHNGYPFKYQKSAPGQSNIIKLSKSALGFIFMFAIAGIVSLVYFTVYKKGKHRREAPAQLEVSISHPQYTTRTESRSWLLQYDNEEYQDEDDDVEEWSPLPRNISTRPVNEQTAV